MAKDEGYIKSYRSLLEWAYIGNPKVLQLWMVLLHLANYKEQEWEDLTIKPGQLVTSIAKICAITSQSPKVTRLCLDKLKKGKQIEVQTTNRYTLITIVNWNKYQSDDIVCKGKQKTNNGQTEDNQRATNNNKKNDKNDKKYIYAQNDSAFDVFWNAYPKKKDKVRARTAFDKFNITDELLQKILTAIDEQKKSEDWQKENGRFIPYPATWLNGHRWEDESKVTTYQKEVSFDVERAEQQAKDNRKDFGSMKNTRRRSK